MDGGSHLATCRIERRGAGRVRVGEAMPATDELGTGGLPGAGVGRVFQERRERGGELTDAVERLDRRPVAVGARHAAECMTDPYMPPGLKRNAALPAPLAAAGASEHQILRHDPRSSEPSRRRVPKSGTPGRTRDTLRSPPTRPPSQNEQASPTLNQGPTSRASLLAKQRCIRRIRTTSEPRMRVNPPRLHQLEPLGSPWVQ